MIKKVLGKKIMTYIVFCFGEALLAGCAYSHSYPQSMATVNSRGEACIVSKPTEEALPHFWFRESGKYCFIHSYSCSKAPYALSITGENPPPCDQMVGVSVDNVDIDLMGNTLKSYDVISAYKNKNSIRNGEIKGLIKMGAYNGIDHIGPGYKVLDEPFWHTDNNLPAGVSLKDWLALNPRREKNVAYINRSIPPIEINALIENIHLQGGQRDLQLAGSGNVVRNSHFEFSIKYDKTKDPASVLPEYGALQYGPRAVIENNTFDVYVDNDDGAIPTYVMYLQNAAGSIVRGNTIRIHGSKKNTIAIGLSMSKDVLIEDNVIENAGMPIEVSGDSSATQRNNRIKQ